MNIKVSEELYNYISAEAEKHGLSKNAVVIFALLNFQMQNAVVPNLTEIIEESKRLNL